MLTVEVAVFIDPFRFKPDTELKSKAVDLVRQLLKRTAKFLLVYCPVPKAGHIQVAFAEPSVVHDEEFYAEICRVPCHLYQLVSVKIKIHAFPVIQQDRPSLSGPFAPAQMGAVSPVEDTG